MSPPPEQLSMIERMERAMVLLAYFIELDGDMHVPMFEKFEAELKALKQTEDVKARARRLLERHGVRLAVTAKGPQPHGGVKTDEHSSPLYG
jgi:2-polyprenyl-6-methoxyphenol hydroxylase-like FAD-dependent oxidoreductase